ncbi:MAG: porphobilinogen synthase [Candidatus Omnitrophica bacterium]|nr:porphobilinogen synthase [Candidatus Omnitrophota bacterium]
MKKALTPLLKKSGSGYNLIMPYFVVEGKNVSRAIASMPGVYQLSVDRMVTEVARAKELGVPGVIIFGIPKAKDAEATGAYDDHGIVQRAVRAVKDKVKGILVITDVCLCEYTSHGHCGVVHCCQENGEMPKKFIRLKDTVALLAKTAVSHVKAGADIVAPSAMMKGQVKAIRQELDKAGFGQTPIMGYSAKFASAFYGPFRDAAESAPRFGDRRSYQLDPKVSTKALSEVAADIAEGADIVMVKPALAYLDIIRQVKDRFDMPLAAYNVSAEYSMVKAAAAKGWIDEKKIVLEKLNAIRRAGASIIISYHACDVMRWKREV